MQKKSDIENLFRKYIENKCNPGEADQLLSYFGIPGNEDVLKELIEKYFELNNAPDSAEYREILDRVYHDIQEEINLQKEYGIIEPKIIPIYKRKWFRLSAAAVLVLGLSVLGYNLLLYKTNTEKDRINNSTAENSEIKLKGNKTLHKYKSPKLVLATGEVMDLGRSFTASIGEKKEIKLNNTNEELIYQKANNPVSKVFNTVYTPKGITYKVRLSDGSSVWLNAGSSLRFPAQFSGKEREVFLTGEAYFEVAHDSKHLFIVSTTKMNIAVLGTKFNVSSYSDDFNQKTTLFQGSIKITKSDSKIKAKGVLLYPGFEAIIGDDSKEIKVNRVRNENKRIWKDKVFVFDNEELSDIMKRLGREYDYKINFANGVNAKLHYTGRIKMSENINEVLELLESIGKIKFVLDDEKINVLNGNNLE